MYTLNIPVSTIRTKMRQEFERHRYVSKLKTTDVLIYNSHAEFQVRTSGKSGMRHRRWKTEGLTHLSYNRRRSTSGSSLQTCSSTSAPRRTPRRDYRRPSSLVSWRYVTLLCYPITTVPSPICSIRHAVRRANKLLPPLQGRN